MCSGTPRIRDRLDRPLPGLFHERPLGIAVIVVTNRRLYCEPMRVELVGGPRDGGTVEVRALASRIVYLEETPLIACYSGETPASFRPVKTANYDLRRRRRDGAPVYVREGLV